MRRSITGCVVIGLALVVYVTIPRGSGKRALAEDEKPKLPLPKSTESNCVKCHLTAGRELTEAVHTFAHSVHDRVAEISCYDCHGGNLQDDAQAHNEKFGFIGTKLSAHLKKCQECHEAEAANLAKGPHFWDHQKRLNIRFPLCVDCHGNHDVGNPPAEFSMTLVCTECHRGFEQKFEKHAHLTQEYDQMWSDILKWQSEHPDTETRFPEPLTKPTAELRKDLSEFFHQSKMDDVEKVDDLSRRISEIRKELKEKTSASAPSVGKDES